jgi:AhpD family alkylhydroperoxidase
MIRRTFLRRTYSRPGELAADLRSLRRAGSAARSGPRSAVAADFRERLMLVVTEVNGCRYCSWFHSGSALTAGIPLPELGELLRGRLPQDTPAEQFPALVYAHQWAERDGRPTAEMDTALFGQYGEAQGRAILDLLRMIRIGNLLGNSFDLALFRLSFGLLGLRRDEARYTRPAA